METGIATRIKSLRKIRIPKWVIFAMIAVVIAVAILTIIRTVRSKSEAQGALEQRTAMVQRGNLTLTLSGSGSVTPSIREEVSSEVNGTVTRLSFGVGDVVKEGDIIIELDDSSAQLSYEKLINNLKQKELTLKTCIKDVEGLNITAPFSGRITNLSVENGQSLNKGQTVFTLVDTSRLKLVVPFNGVGISEITVGKEADVFLQELMQSVPGTVTYVSSKPYVSASGGQLYTVEIQVDNPGLIYEDITAAVQIETSEGTLNSLEAGSLKYINSTVMKSETGGDVEKVYVVENQYVNKGDILVKVENDDVIVSKDSAELQVKDLQTQVDMAQEDLDNYKITSPVNGIVIDMIRRNIGDKIKSGVVLTTIVNTDIMEFNVSIDELDISKIKVGQNVNITVDALEETFTKSLEGEVTSIAIESKSSSGVTTYPVTITLDGVDNLLGGMNANAEILVQDKKDALYIPIEAVTKIGNQSFVWVKGEGQEEGQMAQRPDFNKDRTQDQGDIRNRQGGQLSEEQMKQMSELRDKMQNASDEERQKLRDEMMGSGNFNPPAASQNVSGDDYYKGAYMKLVEIGINNESNIEILSGLQEGDEVVLPPQASTGNDSTQMQNNTNRSMMPMGGLMGGERK